MLYYNFKYCAIPDRRLAITYYACIALVLAYTLIGLVVLNKVRLVLGVPLTFQWQGYLSYDSIIGTLRFRVDKSGYAYRPVEEFDYCTSTNGPKCVALDEYDVRYPLEGDTRSLFLTTAITQGWL